MYGPDASHSSMIDHMGDAEVFDMSEDSVEEADSAEGVSDVCAERFLADASASPFDPHIKKLCLHDTKTPSTEDGDNLSVRQLLCEESDLRGDVWTEDDWVTPVRDRAQTSPRFADGQLNKLHQQVAEIVLSELRIDLQSEVQQVVKEMTSLISDEVTVARQGVEDGMQQFCDTWMVKHTELQSAHASLSASIERMQAGLDEHAAALQRLPQDNRNAKPSLHRLQVSQSESQPSSSVMEARQLAEERKWRLIQSDLEKHLERIEALDKQLGSLSERAVVWDTNIEARISEDRRSCMKLDELHSDLNSRLEHVEGLAMQSSDAVERYKVQDAHLEELMAAHKIFSAKVEDLQSGISRCHDGLESVEEKVMCVSERAIARNEFDQETQEWQMKLDRIQSGSDELWKSTKEWRLELDILRRGFDEQSKSFAEFETRTSHLSERTDSNDARIEEFRVANEASGKKWVSKFDELVSGLDRHRSCIMDRVAEHDAKLRKHVSAENDQIKCKLEQLEKGYEGHVERVAVLDKQSLHLLERAAAQDASMEIRLLEENQQRAKVHELQKGLESFKSGLDQAQKERLVELRVVCGKLEQHEAQLISIPRNLQTQLQSSEKGLAKSITDLGTDLRHSHKELSDQLNDKASQSAVHQAQSSIQSWLLDAKQVYQTMVAEVGKSLDTGTVARLEHSKTLQEHAAWMKDVSAWLEQAQERERGLSHILYRIVEEDYSELTHLFEEAVAVSHVQ